MGNLCRIPKIKRRVSKEGHYHQEDQQRIEWTSQQLIRVLHQLIVAFTRITSIICIGIFFPWLEKTRRKSQETMLSCWVTPFGDLHHPWQPLTAAMQNCQARFQNQCGRFTRWGKIIPQHYKQPFSFRHMAFKISPLYFAARCWVNNASMVWNKVEYRYLWFQKGKNISLLL